MSMPILRGNQFGSALGEALGIGLGSYAGNKMATRALEKTRSAPGYANLSPTEQSSKLQEALGFYGARGEKLMDRELARSSEERIKTARSSLSQILQDENLPPEKGLAAILESNLPPEEKRSLLTAHSNLVRAKATANKPPKVPASEQPISPEQIEKIKAVQANEDYENMDESQQYDALIKAGVSPINAERSAKLRGGKLEREAKEIDKSFEAQKDFIDKVTGSFNAFETETKPRLLQMNALNDNELITPTQEAFLNLFGIPLGAIDNPGSELYDKLSQDLLKGLPESYGNRILKVEVDNFLRTIPQLSNSASGRRLITANLLKLGEIKGVYYNEMRNQQKQIESSGKKYPRDFQQNVLDNVMPQLTKITNEFLQLSQLTDVPDDVVPFFNNQGGISYVDKNNEEDLQNAVKFGGKRIW